MCYTYVTVFVRNAANLVHILPKASRTTLTLKVVLYSSVVCTLSQLCVHSASCVYTQPSCVYTQLGATPIASKYSRNFPTCFGAPLRASVLYFSFCIIINSCINNTYIDSRSLIKGGCGLLRPRRHYANIPLGNMVLLVAFMAFPS
jgi:hypothetical protein